MNGRCAAKRILSLVLLSALALSNVSNAIAGEKLPAFPDGNTKILWDTTDAPFDVVAFLRVPKPGRNAAPLYLDAIFEFSTEVASCFPKKDQERRSALTRELGKRYVDIVNRMEKESVSRAEVNALVSDYAEGFRKIREAQKRPECVFETGLTISTLLPHAQGCRQIARIVDLKAQFDIESGNVNQVLADLELTIRLAEDLRNRGFIINHLVAIALRAIMYSNVVPSILAAEDLNVEQCDRLLTILKRYDSDSAKEFMACTQTEYVAIRNLLHDLEHRIGEFNVEDGGDFRSVGEVFVDLVGNGDQPGSKTAKAVTAMQGQDFRTEVNWLDLNYFRVQEAQRLTYPKRMLRLTKITGEVDKNTRTLAQVLPTSNQITEAFVRSKTRSAGAQCLTAVRRWQIANPKNQQASLLRMVRAAGMDGIPTDPYTGKLMHLVWIDDRPVVYSFGPDGRDDKGTIDWKYNQQPGDFLFRIH